MADVTAPARLGEIAIEGYEAVGLGLERFARELRTGVPLASYGLGEDGLLLDRPAGADGTGVIEAPTEWQLAHAGYGSSSPAATPSRPSRSRTTRASRPERPCPTPDRLPWTTTVHGGGAWNRRFSAGSWRPVWSPRW
ncbi:hypothetical protein ACFZA9_06855 [Streptomyces olivaceus]|uniref:hypothetical protein n=1 Tax=Streptomyces olivaceus TaxID=47716 RepID=UPI0036EB659D